MFRIDGLLYLCLIFPTVFSCLSSGCGGGCGCGGCNSQPPAPASCAPPCPTGYTCGPYGCARNRVFSSVNRKGDILLNNGLLNVSEPIRNMFGITRNKTKGEKTIETDEKDSTLKLDNPNDIFRQCCEDRLLPDSCLSKCSFNGYTRDTLQRMFLNNDDCPIAAAADMQFCAAQGRDHTDCCLQHDVHTTLAGQKCLIFCDQRPGKVTKLDYSFLPCFDRFEDVKQCMYKGMKDQVEE
uniref:Domain of unknown function DB domain-containing protein n=1 Tax=Acrobeloides nanus TaxID=290746 RepID=A0A914E3C5_9BILA